MVHEKSQSRNSLLHSLFLPCYDDFASSMQYEKGDDFNGKREIVLFETDDKEVRLSVPIEDDTVWLNRGQMSELFDRDVKTIGKHINNLRQFNKKGIEMWSVMSNIITWT